MTAGESSRQVFSLKGWNRSAQGNALGEGTATATKPCKGETTPVYWAVVPPFQGSEVRRFRVPRALPWAILFCPFGADEGSHAEARFLS